MNYGRIGDLSAAVAVAGRVCGVVLEERVRYPDGRLTDVDWGEVAKPTLDGHAATGVEDTGLIYATPRCRIEVEAAPFARLRGLGLAVVGGVKRAAGTVGVVLQRCEDDLVTVGTLGDKLRADAGLDPRAGELDDRAGVDGEPACRPRLSTRQTSYVHRRAVEHHAVAHGGGRDVQNRPVDSVGDDYRHVGGQGQVNTNAAGGHSVADQVELEAHGVLAVAHEKILTVDEFLTRFGHDELVSAVGSQRAGSIDRDGPARVAGDDYIFGYCQDHVHVVEPGRDVELLDRVGGGCGHAEKQCVEAVGNEFVAVQIGADPVVVGGERTLAEAIVEGRLQEAVRIGRHGRVRAVADGAEGDGGPGLEHVNRIVNVLDAIDGDLSATVADVGVVDVVEEDAFLFEDDSV